MTTITKAQQLNRKSVTGENRHIWTESDNWACKPGINVEKLVLLRLRSLSCKVYKGLFTLERKTSEFTRTAILTSAM